MARLDMEPLCEAFEAPVPSPAGGSAAAAAAAIAASLVVMAGRGSPNWPEGAAAADAAAALRERLLVLGGEDVEAVAAVIAGSRARARTGDGEDAFVQALVRAADVPLEIAGCAADVAELADRARQSCRRPLRAEAAAAAALAAAAAQIASSIVTGNLAAFPPGYPGEEIARLRDEAHLASARAGKPGALPQPPAVS